MRCSFTAFTTRNRSATVNESRLLGLTSTLPVFRLSCSRTSLCTVLATIIFSITLKYFYFLPMLKKWWLPITFPAATRKKQNGLACMESSRRVLDQRFRSSASRGQNPNTGRLDDTSNGYKQSCGVGPLMLPLPRTLGVGPDFFLCVAALSLVAACLLT